MIHNHIVKSRTLWSNRHHWSRNCLLNGLIKSRNIFNIQTIEYDLMAVCSTDLDPTGNFLLVGLSNGSVDLQGIQDANFGTLDGICRLNLSLFNLHRVQWNPCDEQFFSMLDNHNLYLVDPNEMRTLETYSFSLKTNWSEWNINDKRIIAVCGTESQTRLVDIRGGSSVHTIILGSKSGLASHRATRCLWSKHDSNCLIVGDNEGCIHVYDTRHSTKPYIVAGEERGQISGMSFTSDNLSIITSQGTENRLIQWTYDKCSLIPHPNKFKKHQDLQQKPPANGSSLQEPTPADSASTSKEAKRSLSKKVVSRKKTRRIIPLPVDAYLRCQFYVSDRHVCCPAPPSATKSKELYIFDIESGYRIKTLKSDNILCQGVYSITGLMPESLVLYVGGRGRLRVWSLDEDYQRKREETMKKYHRTRWDSDDEM